MHIEQFLNRAPGSESLPGQGPLCDRVVAKLASNKNIALVAHRGWGKTALMKDIGFKLSEQQSNVWVFYFDLKIIYDRSVFIRTLIQDLCKSLSMETPARLNSSTLDYCVMDLIEAIAIKKRKKLIIFISNFQNISRFETDYIALRKLNLIWKKQKNCAYCISGSNFFFFKKHFNKVGSPFYGFCRLYFLRRNFILDYQSYINSLFFLGGRLIDPKASILIAQMMENHLFYIQVLSWNAFLRTRITCTVPIVVKTIQFFKGINMQRE